LRLPFVALTEFTVAEYDMIINATPVGKEGEELPVDFSLVPSKSVVIDLVFSSCATPLSTMARRCGHTVIDGRDILLVQAARQYYLMTGETMPVNLARRLLGLPDAIAHNGETASAHHNGRFSFANF